MQEGLLDGASPGATGTVSESGWSNGAVFRTYLETHFLKFIPGRSGEKVVLILDGHRSHVSIGLIDWALENNIVLFILPAHTSHLLQPMDVACYGPFERIYNSMCHKQIRETAEIITRYNVCKIACQVYTKALCAENLISAFRKTGIYPLDPQAISRQYIIPSEVYITDATYAQPETTVEEADVETPMEVPIEIEIPVEDVHQVEQVPADERPTETEQQGNDLFETRERVLKTVKREGADKKRRKTMSKIVSGKEATDNSVYAALVQHEENQRPTKNRSISTTENKTETRKGKTQGKSSRKTTEKNTDPQPKEKTQGKSSRKTTEKNTDPQPKEKTQDKGSRKTTKKNTDPQPGPSHINLANDSSDDSDTDDDVGDEEKCCVCGLWTPTELAGRVSIMFTKWVQCDGVTNGVPCKHWTHLIYCTKARVVRRGVSFFCKHCTSNANSEE